MSNPVFPALPSGKQMDSSKTSVARENPVQRTELEGGYVATRAKHTRAPRKTWSCGFTFISNADKGALETFWDTVKGGSVAFDWTNPQDSIVYTVRFKGDPLKFSYVGRGTAQYWDVTFDLEQV
jgi:phage-related protein